MIRIGKDFIAIVDKNGKERFYWNKKEWEEDSEVVFSIINAVVIDCVGEKRENFANNLEVVK